MVKRTNRRSKFIISTMILLHFISFRTHPDQFKMCKSLSVSKANMWSLKYHKKFNFQCNLELYKFDLPLPVWKLSRFENFKISIYLLRMGKAFTRENRRSVWKLSRYLTTAWRPTIVVWGQRLWLIHLYQLSKGDEFWTPSEIKTSLSLSLSQKPSSWNRFLFSFFNKSSSRSNSQILFSL